MTGHTATRSRWGRSRFGGSSAALVAVSLAAGAVCSAGIAAAYLALNDVQRPGLAVLVFMACTLPITSALAWVILLDRSTLDGALDAPEDSVESAWYDAAARGAFGDVLVIAGVGAAVFALSPLEVPNDLVLGGLVLAAMGDFAVRYWWLRRSSA